jgi:phosphoribulokinase
MGMTRTMKGLLFAIIPHRSHVNLQLVDGIDLPNPYGKVEGTGKRARHVKVRSVEDAASPWLIAAIDGQVAVFRARTAT